ncbi:MAG: OmpA family protein [Acidimicrobiales bacterium]
MSGRLKEFAANPDPHGIDTDHTLPDLPARTRPTGAAPAGVVEAIVAPTVDLDRLRASAESALDAERRRPADEPPSPAPTAEEPAEGDAARRPATAVLVVLALLALATAGVAAFAMGGNDGAARTEASPRAAVTITSPPVTESAPTIAPTTIAPTTAAPVTAPPTTAPPSVPPTTAPPAPAAPTHKAVYRAGKLYLEDRISSAEEAQQYIAKAAAVLGPDNVVNQYVVDPSVPVSTDGTVYVDEPFLFATGSAELDPAYTGVLGLGVAALRLSPAARMVVTGYTDNVGDPAKNLALSTARANAVVDYMVTTGGIDRARFDAVGAGDQNPVGDNGTEEGRARNRRIDVRFVNLLA